jgi:predicted acetyltransferase
VGYGQAGGHFSVRVPTHALPEGAHGLPLRRATTGDWPALHALYARVARTRPGWLDRGPYLWSRVDRPRAGPAQGYVVGEEGAPEGYAFVLRVHRPEGDRHELRLTDFVTTTERASRRLLSFFAHHRSLADAVVWNGLPQEPVLSLLREQSWAVRLEETWLLRLVDVPAALQARGWPRAARGELHLEVQDALFPENAGRWVLSVEEGRARVRPGGAGHLKLDVSALASLYTGFRSVEALAQVGQVEATPEVHELCTVLFAGALPTLPEMF